MARIPVTKTPKVYVGGQFIRSESGRVFPVREAGSGKRDAVGGRRGAGGGGAEARLLGNIPQCTRKDLRNAVEAAAKAGPGWAARTPYNRGQILYRLGEMLESRSAEMADSLVISGAATKAAAAKEVAASVDRLIYYAGWADKYEQVLGNTNPVAGPFFNFTVAEPMGIIGIIADDGAPLLGLLSQIAPVIIAGNTCVCLASQEFPYPAIVLGELLAVSDLPGGVVNILTGFRKELVPTFATHTHIRGLSAVVDQAEKKELQLGAAESIKRVRSRKRDDDLDWSDAKSQSVYEIRDFIEFKTTWHPIGA
ncbi:MAG TPA: aldehyde dehydrogenase family protein [Gemmatimonadaceae bacterium]|nr:aldehyde dehydrogenase family protein [Gemmatimonadaceae bacterium]